MSRVTWHSTLFQSKCFQVPGGLLPKFLQLLNVHCVCQWAGVSSLRGVVGELQWTKLRRLQTKFTPEQKHLDLEGSSWGSHMHCLCWFVLTMPSSAAPFQIQVFLLRDKLHLEPSRFCLLELTNYASQARDACPLTNAMNVEGAYKGGPQKSGSIHFETMIECHVALDVHAIPIV